jgi:hypothetical protein
MRREPVTWLRIEKRVGVCEHGNEYSGSTKILSSSGIAGKLFNFS